MAKFPDLQIAINSSTNRWDVGPFGVMPDDIDAAIGESIELCLKMAETISIKGE